VFTSTGDVEITDRTVPVLGLDEGVTLLGIDIRPSNGVLYGVGSNGQVVTINSGSGQTTPLGAPIPEFDPSDGVGFDFNTDQDVLVRQDPANDGTLRTIGDLGADVTDAVGFDSSGGLGQTTFAVLNVDDAQSPDDVQGLYVIDLATGEATLLRTIIPGTYTAFAVGDAVAPPAPG